MESNQTIIDGPYVYNCSDEQFRCMRIVVEGDTADVYVNYVNKSPPVSISCFIDHAHEDKFVLDIKDRRYFPPGATYPKQERIFALADIEGNFDAFQRLLKANGIIDENYDWIYGAGHLVLNGDFVDRGQNVIPLLWLIYKLEEQAIEQEGKVHFILGNHEDFFITGNTKYVHDKYKTIARHVTGMEDPDVAFRRLNSESLLLREWMLSKNTVEKIGDILFVHGGVSHQLLDSGLSIDEINSLIRLGMPRMPVAQKAKLPLLELLFGPYGPLWYRGFVFSYKDYQKDDEAHIQKVLKYFNAKHIVIGHNMVDEISADFNKKLYRIDVKQSDEKYKGSVQGLLIEDGLFFRVDDKGNRTQI